MSRALDYEGLARVFLAGAANVKNGAEELGRLDSAIGDGDHGVAMTRAMEALEKAVDACEDRNAKSLLQGVAWAVMSIDAGSTGPLMGSLLIGMGEPTGEAAEIDTPLLAAMFSAGLAKLQTISQAQVGDKTMIDALSPAIDALRQAADDGLSVAQALKQAAKAAEAGARASKQFQAKFGKACNLGQRSVGHQDPGATSMAMLIRGFADGANYPHRPRAGGKPV